MKNLLINVIKTILESLYNFSLEKGVEKPYANIITISYCLIILTIFFNKDEIGNTSILAIIITFIALLLNFFISICTWKKILSVNTIEKIILLVFPILAVLFMYFTGGTQTPFILVISLFSVILPLFFSLRTVLIIIFMISLFYFVLYFVETSSIKLNELSIIVMNIYLFFLIALLVNSTVQRERASNERLQEVNQELAEIDKVKSKFLSDITHDLKNPITTIISLCEKLETSDNSNSESINLIKKESYRLLNMVRNSFNLSEIEQGRFKIYKEEVDITELLIYIIQLYKSQNFSINLKVDYGIPNIYIDREKITQVLHNIINNAIKYSPEGSKIIIKLSKNDKYVIISIKDNGIGIPKDDLPYIFNRFYRSKNAKFTTGSGLGLHISKHIVELHNGYIDVKSKENVGTTFNIYLPY